MNTGDLTKYCRGSRLVSKPVLDELMVLHLDTAYYYALNASACQIWNFCAEPRTFAEITDFLRREHHLTPAQAETDTRRCLFEMLEENLLSSDSQP